MTDTQLYFAIGIPGALFALNFLGVLAAAFWQSKRFDDQSKRFDDLKDLIKSEIGGVKSEIGSVKSDLARAEGVLSSKIDGLTLRVKALEDEIHSPLVKR